MKVRCPSCRTLYRLDPAPEPVGERTARCGRCAEVFRIADHIEVETAQAPAAVEAAHIPEPVVEDSAVEVGASMEEAPAPEASTVEGEVEDPMIETAPQEAPAMAEAAVFAGSGEEDEGESGTAVAPESGEAVEAPAAESVQSSAEAAPSSFRFFGPQDPHQRARHLARALVSDIVAYYPDRIEKSRAEGTLREEFKEEVLKSWEEFVLQVGADFARETNHFQDALNDILAQGEKVF